MLFSNKENNMQSVQFYEPTLRVLALTPGLAPGGAEQHLTTLVRHASRVKYAGIITLDGAPRLSSQLGGVPVCQAKREEDESHDNAIVRAVHEQVARGLRFDLIMYWGFGPMNFDALKVPVVHVTHASGMEKANEWTWKWTQDRGESLAHYHVAVSESAVLSFSERVRKSSKIHVIHNGADTERTCVCFGRDHQRNLWGIPNDKKVVLYVGRLFEGKGADLLVKAMRYLPQDYVAVIYGWGDQARDLRVMAEETPGRVFFPLPQLQALGDVYAASDVVAIPSSSEAFPLVMIEAFHAGVPLVCSEFNTLKEVETVYFGGEPAAWHTDCPPKPEHLAKSIQLATTSDASVEIVRRAAVISRRHFSASAMVGRWESFYYQCCQEWLDISRNGAIETI